MEYEILKHWDKILKISQISDGELVEARQYLFAQIIFINNELIPIEIRKRAFEYVKGVDPDDHEFVALTEYLKGKLWTGDKSLYKHLMQQGYKNVLNTSEISALTERSKS